MLGTWPPRAAMHGPTVPQARGTSSATTSGSCARLPRGLHTHGLACSSTTSPPRSPDLNPVELFWGWVRKRLQKLDLDDLVAERSPVTRRQLTARLRGILQTQRARAVARNCFMSLQKTCEEVRRKRGAASGA